MKLYGKDDGLLKDFGSVDVDGKGSVLVSAGNLTIDSGYVYIVWTYEDEVEVGRDDNNEPIMNVESGTTETSTNFTFTEE